MARCIVLVAVLVACADHKKSEGLPPAQEWGATDPNGAAAAAPAAPGASPHAANPHAGMDMGGAGADPHAGLGLDMGAGGGANPHAGLDMGAGGTPDVSKLGLPPPDPNRAIDPAHHVKGVIRIDPKAKDRVAPGGAVFVIVKRADASGAASGPPLAVDKLTWSGGDLPFEMTEAQAMIGGTQLVGDVVVSARYDHDGDAMTKQPGDVTGQIKVKIPADDVKLVLDTILP